jgi:hypothetical protein
MLELHGACKASNVQVEVVKKLGPIRQMSPEGQVQHLTPLHGFSPILNKAHSLKNAVTNKKILGRNLLACWHDPNKVKTEFS